MQKKWQYRVAIAEALDWTLHGVSLNQAITDNAEDEFDLSEIECSCVIETIGDEFVATLEELAREPLDPPGWEGGFAANH